MAVVDQAIAGGIDLLVCHHPLFFRSVHAVSGLGFRGEIVRKLNLAGCALWVGHTNADAAYRGVGMAAADMFGLVDQRPLVPIDDPDAEHPVGLGRVGRLAEPVALRDFASRVAGALPYTELGVQVCGDLDVPVSTVAVLPGSGDSLFDEVRAVGADVYVTSDLRHHPVTDAIEQAAMRLPCVLPALPWVMVTGVCVRRSSTLRTALSNPCGSSMRWKTFPMRLRK